MTPRRDCKSLHLEPKEFTGQCVLEWDKDESKKRRQNAKATGHSSLTYTWSLILVLRVVEKVTIRVHLEHVYGETETHMRNSGGLSQV